MAKMEKLFQHWPRRGKSILRQMEDKLLHSSCKYLIQLNSYYFAQALTYIYCRPSRENVLFHDGTPFNCSAAILNFDHVLSDVVRQRHQWFGAGKYLKSWTCNGESELVLETSSPFYPLLQELTYIRPLRFASPSAFAEGLASDPDLHNSCESGDFGSKWDKLEDDVKCKC